MKRKIIIISASVVVLALIVTMGIYAQGGQKSQNTTTTQTQNIPDKCKDCPSKAKCFDGKDQTAQTTTGCATKCADKKTCADASKCGEKKSCGDAAKCEGKKVEAKGCPSASDCKKSCEKKSN